MAFQLNIINSNDIIVNPKTPSRCLPIEIIIAKFRIIIYKIVSAL